MEDNKLPALNRFITDHNQSGKAIFSNSIPEQLVWHAIPEGARLSLSYATKGFPVDLKAEKDVSTYNDYTRNLPGITIPGGTVLRLVDMKPGAQSAMHRTVSLDYGVVLEGEVELVLDSGEVRLLKRGDVAVQRGTNHAWRNTSETSWSRMLYVLLDAEPLEIAGQKLEEDYGGMAGVRPSG